MDESVKCRRLGNSVSCYQGITRLLKIEENYGFIVMEIYEWKNDLS